MCFYTTDVCSKHMEFRNFRVTVAFNDVIYDKSNVDILVDHYWLYTREKQESKNNEIGANDVIGGICTKSFKILFF